MDLEAALFFGTILVFILRQNQTWHSSVLSFLKGLQGSVAIGKNNI